MIDKWDERFLKLTYEIAQWSKDKSTKCGAIIVDHDHNIIGTGYNGFPKNIEDSDERLDNRELKYKIILHSEENCLIRCNKDVTGMTMYVTDNPCAHCASHIIANGIKRVVFPIGGTQYKERWKEQNALALQLFEEAGVTVDQVEFTSEFMK
jgi:dCMP deaminase